LGLLINHFSKWAFIHIPKTGGTSLTNTLLKDKNTEQLSVHDSIRLLDCDDTYFIFTIVRNPFTRICSAYEDEYRKGNTTDSFSSYLKNIDKTNIWLLPQSYFIEAGKTKHKKVSFIGRYENYENDCNEILKKLNYTEKIPHLNRNPIYDRHPNLNQEEYYTKIYFTEDWMIDWVRERYENDFKILNYDMDLPR
jgi:hypothetical protein